MGIENRAVAPQAAGLQINTTGVHATNWHAIGRRVRQIVYDATHRLIEAIGVELRPLIDWGGWWK